MIKPEDLFDISQTEHSVVFEECERAWDVLPRIKEYLEDNLKPELKNSCTGGAWIGEEVYIGEGTVVEDGVMIKGPAWIGKNCELRHGAYIRENVIIGDGCVIGNSCEFKNSLLFNDCQVPHFNYVGDAVLGHKAHLGAGVIISNLKVVPGNVVLNINGEKVDSGLRKFGALLGDHTDIGCNSVLNPGSIIGRNTMMYPTTNWRGVVDADRIVKNKAAIEIVELRK
ncbi:MAG: UDP-N-acetylglucosamine diphosphorylase [Verrucomicrobiales bacterium]|nr:UDP-N-acetylglucosamine diphosphorylase [Verrucomicrobiales bacterium]|tara:strand:+ start:98 stop:775 length:678 start_codon:yes stop_codon:yes gene_type:complete